MVLATRCPHCETVFRVPDELLARANGWVRCGHCQQVFNASQHLVEESHDEFKHEESRHAEPKHEEPKHDEPKHDELKHDELKHDEPKHDEPKHEPTASFGPGAWDMWKPAANGDVGMRHDIESVSREPIVVPGALAPLHEDATEPSLEPAQVHEPQVPEPQAPAASVEPPPATESAPVQEAEPAAPIEPEAPFDTALDEPREPTFSAPPPPASEPALAPNAHADFASTGARDEVEPSFSPEPTPAWHADPEPHFGAQPATESTEPLPFAADVPPAASDGARHFEVTRETRPRKPGRVLWRIAGSVIAVLLIALLLAQLAWWRRETVIVSWPETQPLFAGACAHLGCHIAPPRDIEGLRVESTELRQIDGPHRLELRVSLRNHSGVALAYPAIELTLSDNKNDVAIRRVLWPQDYAPPGTPIAGGLPSHMTQTMVVQLDSGNTVATNFRVQIFYP
ncbi:DUF3426 domain-containing protein [Trinickia fusca]|uniref:DUF3426 domain-containing protein n=1 Tax=Trinickia fusca TaxID=2419777 RepID=A0A494XSU0_9BURK|nr:DUF3426 domain-containing protein [Trinickia fusca]RKP51159.1 DUF3426 domain-containing protein [Trinickia fusca]